MKKFICFICLFFMFLCPAIADNIDHQAEWEMETVLEMMDADPAFEKASRQQLFKDDIDTYFSGIYDLYHF